MPKTPRISAKDFFKYLIRYGCTATTIRGSHHKIINPKNNKVSTVAIHSNAILYPSMFLRILQQLEINSNDFIEFINQK